MTVDRQSTAKLRQRDAAEAETSKARRSIAIPSGKLPRRGVAKIVTNEDSGWYTITEQWYDPGAEEWGNAIAPRGLVDADTYEVSGYAGGSADDMILFQELPAKGGTRIVVFSAAGIAGSVFACLVWRDGGTTDGSKTVPCNRTYTAKTLGSTLSTGTTLGTALTPKKTRPSAGKLATPATTGVGVTGLGYYDSAGAFCLYDANETLAPQACT